MGFSLYILAILILTVASLGQSIFGFGAGLIAIPLLSQILPVKDAVTLALLLQLVLGGLVIPYFRSLCWKRLKWLLVGMMPFTILGTAMLWMFDDRILRWVLAFVLFAFLVRSVFFREVRLPWLATQLGAFGAGSAAGVVQGMMGTSGPILVMYLVETVPERVVFRTSLLLVLFLSNLLRIALAGPMGLLNHQVVVIGGFALPFILFAMWAGDKLHNGISENVYRSAILGILSFALLMLVVNS